MATTKIAITLESETLRQLDALVERHVALTSQPQRAGFPLTLALDDDLLGRPAWVKISQVRTLSIGRIGKRAARLTPEQVSQVLEGLNEILGA